MKKSILAICSLIALTACQSYDEPIDNGNIGGEKVIVKAYINGSDATRIILTPTTDEEGEPIIQASWSERGDKILVYDHMQLAYNSNRATPSEFTQVSGCEFEGVLPDCSSFKATYNCTLEGDTWQSLRIRSCNMSEQDGVLGSEDVIMMSKTLQRENTTDPIIFDFDYLNFILKLTFKVNSEDIDSSITKIEMGNLDWVNSADNKVTTITVTPSALDDIYVSVPTPTRYPFNTLTQVYGTGRVFPFTVTTDSGDVYNGSLTLPCDLEMGKFYTATIDLEPSADM